jgi:RNase P subunit RPR2
VSAQTALSQARVLSNLRCSLCRAPILVQRITPSRTGREHWTLRCTKCGHIHQMQVASNPSQSNPVDWFDSALNTLK